MDHNAKTYSLTNSVSKRRFFGGSVTHSEGIKVDMNTGLILSESKLNGTNEGNRNLNIIGFALTICLFVTVFRVLSDASSGDFSFTSLLYALRDAPTISFDWFNQIKFFDPVGNFLVDLPIIGGIFGAFKGLSELITLVVEGLIQMILYIGYFIDFLF